MKIDDLKIVMKYYLAYFKKGKPVSDDTKHKSVLSATDGYGSANSKQLYRSFVRWSLAQENHSDPRWPTDWMDLTVEELASALIDEETKLKAGNRTLLGPG